VRAVLCWRHVPTCWRGRHAAGRDMRAPVSATKRDRQDTGERGRGEARDTLAAHVRLSSQPTTARAARCYPTALCCRCCAFWHALCGLIHAWPSQVNLGPRFAPGGTPGPRSAQGCGRPRPRLAQGCGPRLGLATRSEPGSRG